MKLTTLTCRVTVLLLAAILASCAATSRQAEEEQARIAAEQQAQLEEQARLQAQQQEEARRAAEREQQLEAERQRQLAAEQAAREEAERQAAAERERVAAEQRRQEQARQAAERARVVAEQQARVAELRAQIAANNQEAANLDSANGALREAVSRAEELTTLLNEEQVKYDDIDPATGQPRNALARERIEQLSTEIERLRAQAAAVSVTP